MTASADCAPGTISLLNVLLMTACQLFSEKVIGTDRQIAQPSSASLFATNLLLSRQ